MILDENLRYTSSEKIILIKSIREHLEKIVKENQKKEMEYSLSKYWHKQRKGFLC